MKTEKKHFFFLLIFMLIMSSSFANTFYWIGNSGHWNDPDHWSYSSGGVSNGKIPTIKDNVIIDQNSFTEDGTIHFSRKAFCHDFIFAQQHHITLFSSNSSKWKINGSFIINNSINNEFHGTITFNANEPGNNISTSDMDFPGNLVFKGKGTWQMASNLSVPKSNVALKRGTLDLNGNTLNVHNLYTKGSNATQLNVENAVLKASGQWSMKNIKNLNIIGNNNSLLYVPQEVLNLTSSNNNNKPKFGKSTVVNNKSACTLEATPFYFTAFIRSDYNTFGVSCIDSCDAELSVRIDSGGIGPFSFGWINGPNDSLWQGVCQGSYNVVVRDLGQTGALCVSAPPVSVTEPPAITTFQNSYIEPTCNGDCDGEISILALGGVGGFSYNWTNSGNTTSRDTLLCAANHPLIITDDNGCTFDTIYALDDPDPITFDLDSVDVDCFGNCSGSAITSSVAGGNGIPYSYTWNTTPVQTTPTATNLCPGTYTVVVEDAMLCSATDSITVNIPSQIILDSSQTNVQCGGDCDGIATVNVLGGGTGPFTHNWSNGTVETNNSSTITALCAGTYRDSIVDANGCDTVIVFTITEPDTLLTTSTATNITCYAACDGTIKTTPRNGTTPYDFLWSNTQTTDSIFGLCPGQYSVIITDDNGCQVFDTITLTEPDSLDPNTISTDISCNGVCDGSAIAAPIGGVLPYSYSWSNGANTQTINALCDGQYILTLTDSNNCIARDTVDIAEPTVLVVNPSATNISCGATCDGVATANPSGGTAPYNYLWDNGDNTQTTTTGLCAGTYGVTVTDDEGCQATDSATIVNAIGITVDTDTIEISCNGVCDGQAIATASGGTPPYDFLWDDPLAQTTATATGLCPGNYTITVTDDDNCSSSEIVTMPIDPSVLFPNGLVQDISCFGLCDGEVASSPSGGTPPYSISWSVADTFNLCAGDYTVTVTDDNGCMQDETLTVTEPDSITITTTIGSIDCNSGTGGSISLAISGGTPFTVGSGYTFLWAPGGETTSSITNLSSGTYTVTVTDSLGCSKQETIVLTEPTNLAAIPIAIDVTCNGDNDGIAAVVVGGGTPNYTYNWSPGGETTDSIFNLSPGTYSVLITDDNNCTLNEDITISEPDPLVANVSGTFLGCDGSCVGTASSVPTGGTTPYTYSWNTAPTQTSDNITNLCAGSYTVTVTDANNCIDAGTHIVTLPPPLSVTLDSTNITCVGDNDGTATATPTAGTAPYTFNWVPGNMTTAAISNLTPQLYTVTVTDSNGCFFIGTINITEPTAIMANPTVTNATCGVNDGSIIMNPTGGTSPYAHSWSNGSTSNGITGLGVGFYTDTITDGQGCVEINTQAISNPTGPTGIITTVIDATCYGGCDGSANIIPIGGTPSYNYDWNIPGETDSTITGQCAGTLNLTITDNAGCVLNTTVLIGETDSITANETQTNASCNGSCDGTASVTPTGGTSPYTYLWSTGAQSSSISGLCAGPVSVVITDANGCTQLVNFTITEPSVLTSNSSSTDVLCFSDCNGTGTATPSGGTAPYFYVWNDPSAQTTQTATGLCPGNYDVTITDMNGCATNDNVSINEPTTIVANEVVSEANCGVCDGSITLTPSGGTGSYTYDWLSIGGFTNPSVNALCAGTYTVEITDDNNCTERFSIGVNNVDGPDISTNSTNPTCDGFCDGDASVTVLSGNGPYTYLWTGNPGGQTTSSINGLCEGSYTIEVTDVNGCISVLPVTLTDNGAITTTVFTTNATCNGNCDGTAMVAAGNGVPMYSYNWSNGSTTNASTGLCSGGYSVTITDDIGCSTSENITITAPNLLNVSLNGTDATCDGLCNGTATATPVGGTGPYTYLWSNGATTATINSLCPQTYNVTVTDANGCSATGSFTVGNAIPITATLTSTNALCGNCDGTADASAAGGSGSPYTYLWSPNGATSANISNLCAGSYTVEITDNSGCSKDFVVLISNPNGPSLTLEADSIDCFGTCNATASVSINSGTAPFTYQWNDPALQTTDSARNLCGGSYSVIVSDGNNCISIDTISVYEPQQLTANIIPSNPSCPAVCDGIAMTNTTGGTGNYTYVWNANPALSNATETGLCAGTHTVTIQDENLCSITDSITLIDPSTISVQINTTNVVCNNDCNGTALAVLSGGTPPYSYSWSTSPAQNAPLAINLCSGIDTLSVTDANGCIYTDTFSLNNPPVLSTSTVSSVTSCINTCDGVLITSPTGGAAPYSYSWSNGQTTASAIGLCPNTYAVLIVDDNGCGITDTADVTSPASIDDGTVVVGPNCGANDGTATANPNGIGPYTYLWGNGQTSQTATGLAAGVISLSITDQGSGCSYDYSIIVNSSTGPNVTLTGTDETCTNRCDGGAMATASGGNPPYTYSWNTTPAQNDSNATNLCAGSYTVTVTDALMCITTDTISITSNALNLSVSNIVPETCYDDCDGQASVTANTGIAPYTFSWNTNPSQTTATATNLCDGSYIATVTDSLNCIDSTSVTITGPDSLATAITVNSPIVCNGSAAGSLTAVTSGGTTGYTYLWSNGETTPTINNLTAGTYFVEVTDANGCFATDTLTLTEPTAILANETLVFPNCNVCDGSITINPTGGSGPYTYLWSTNDVGISITNLCANAYSVEITDLNNCTNTFNYALSNINAPAVDLEVQNITCNGLIDGSITANATGGTPPYISYAWSPSGQTTTTATNLSAGTYSVNVTDSIGCVGIAIDSVIEPDVLQANISSDNISCFGLCDGWASVNISGGVSPYNTSLWLPDSVTTDSITDLCAGTYTAVISDSNGCMAMDSVTITEPIGINAAFSSTNTSCSSVCEGTASLVSVTGGAGTYTYSWSPGNQTTDSVNDLCFGTNTVTVTDQNNCSIDFEVNIGADDTITANAGSDTTICNNLTVNLNGVRSGNVTSVQWLELPNLNTIGNTDTITAPQTLGTICYVYRVSGACDVEDTVCITTTAVPNANAGDNISLIEGSSTTLNASGGGTYSWTPTDFLSDSTINNPVANPEETTTYTVTITSDSGCVATDSVTITVFPTIAYSDGITPNGDGKNDVWIIQFIEAFPDNVVEIYNRWGELIFHADGYQQDWDGTYNGKELPVGTYYYIIDLKDGITDPYTGPITILR